MTANGDGAPFNVTYIDNRWTVAWNGLDLEATGPRFDQATIRCTLSVTRENQLLYRDNVNLTGAKARARFIRALQAQAVELAEAPLLALDEAIRKTPRNRAPGGVRDVSAPPVEFSGTVPTLDDLDALVRKWLRLADRDVLRLLLAAVAGHRAGGESPWLLIVGPPSGVKTELLRLLNVTSKVVRLSSLTARTFASGLDSPGAEPSLLGRLTEEVLVLKDFTTVLQLPHDERQGVLAQLREIYDGHFDKYWGTGKELHWEGHLGFLAGVTEMIDRHHSVMGLLGPRFLLLRLHYAADERTAAALKALRNAGRQEEMRQELAQATAAFLASLPADAPEVGPAVQAWLVSVADLVTHARSPVDRDPVRATLQYAPQPEVPARLAQQLQTLLHGLLLVGGGRGVTPGDLRGIARVAWDCVPVIRGAVLRLLAQLRRPVETHAIATALPYPLTTVRRTLEDLQALKLVSCRKVGKADGWLLREQWRAPLLDLLRRLRKVPVPAGTTAPRKAARRPTPPAGDVPGR